MKISVDRDRCEGYGVCAEVAPDLLHLDDDGELVVDVEDLTPEQTETAASAARVCPVAALSLRDAG
ncbi:ferredoxin [Pseudonocardia thermophila]|jgi:Ferredoxin|uniref:Ferredoxin n=1 Tax=Pseudonocardia thermophila TaxID=1848 RepID=A0A1M6UXH3_PSETH|nr:ferredoxin [Pseudonocardia thermophila]SHK73959.1 ferredoxin [Pseudonocardia thermophila]